MRACRFYFTRPSGRARATKTSDRTAAMEPSAAEARIGKASSPRARTTPTPVDSISRGRPTYVREPHEKSGRVDGRTEQNRDHRQADERGPESREDLTPVARLDRIEIAPPRAGGNSAGGPGPGSARSRLVSRPFSSGRPGHCPHGFAFRPPLAAGRGLDGATSSPCPSAPPGPRRCLGTTSPRCGRERWPLSAPRPDRRELARGVRACSRSEASPSGPGAAGAVSGSVSTLAFTFRRRSRSRQSRRAMAMSQGRPGAPDRTARSGRRRARTCPGRDPPRREIGAVASRSGRRAGESAAPARRRPPHRRGGRDSQAQAPLAGFPHPSPGLPHRRSL